MNKTIGVVLAIVVIIGGIYLFTRNSNKDESASGAPKQNEDTSVQGQVIFSVTDAAANMGAISEINIAVSKVEVHNSTVGWMTVSSTPRTYSLLALNASKESKILADIKTRVGNYDQVRVRVDSATVKTKAGATKTAQMPSHEIAINTRLVVKEGSTSSVHFDFLADKSIYTDTDGEYVFAPTVKTETKSDAEVSIDSKGTVSIIGGTVEDSSTVGMDVDGSIKLNFQIDKTKKIDLGTNATLDINGTLK